MEETGINIARYLPPGSGPGLRASLPATARNDTENFTS